MNNTASSMAQACENLNELIKNPVQLRQKINELVLSDIKNHPENWDHQDLEDYKIALQLWDEITL